MRSSTWTVGVLGVESDRLLMAAVAATRSYKVKYDKARARCKPALPACTAGSIGGRGPLAIEQAFVWLKAGLVAHLGALLDPVAQVDVRQRQRTGLFDLPQHAVGAVAAMRLGFVEGVDGRQSVVEHIDDRDHLQAGRLASLIGFVELDQARVDAA